MSKRNEAVKLLKDAETALTGRIADVVIEHGTDLVDSLSGEGYADSNVLFEMADNLHRIKVLLAEMPAEEVKTVEDIWAYGEPVKNVPAGEDFVMPVLLSSQSLSTGMLGAQPQANMRVFFDKVTLGKLEEAAHDLSLLTGLPLQYVVNSTALFASKLEREPDMEAQLMSLRAQLHTSVNGSIMLLHDLFGITGPAAVTAYTTLRTMV